MRKFLFAIALTLSMAHAFNLQAQTVDIYPVPQEIKWGQEVAFCNNTGYAITGEDTADADAVNLFKKSLNTDGGEVEVIMGERGDEAVAAYESLIPQKTEGYYLAVEKGKVVIAGNDGSGTFYGVQTFLQMA